MKSLLCQHYSVFCALWFCGVFSLMVQAAPGAHGPNGEHLDSLPMQQAVNDDPRFEAVSDLFEIVGTLTSGQLVLFVSDYASNAPVLNAQVEIESHGINAVALFRETGGDYVISDGPLQEKLLQAGEYPLVITVFTQTEADLLSAVLSHPAQNAEEQHHHGLSVKLIFSSLLLLVALCFLSYWSGRKHTANQSLAAAGKEA